MTDCKHDLWKIIKPHWYLDFDDLPGAAEKKLISTGICIFLVHTTKAPKTKQLHTGSPPTKLALKPDPQFLGLFSSKTLKKEQKKAKKNRKKLISTSILRFAQNCSGMRALIATCSRMREWASTFLEKGPLLLEPVSHHIRWRRAKMENHQKSRKKQKPKKRANHD